MKYVWIIVCLQPLLIALLATLVAVSPLVFVYVVVKLFVPKSKPVIVPKRETYAESLRKAVLNVSTNYNPGSITHE